MTALILGVTGRIHALHRPPQAPLAHNDTRRLPTEAERAQLRTAADILAGMGEVVLACRVGIAAERRA